MLLVTSLTRKEGHSSPSATGHMDHQTDIAEIYEQFSSPLKSFIAKRVSDPSAAEDLVHDVFVRIHSRISTLADREKLAPWIYQIARNAVIDFYRNKKETIITDEDLPLEQQELRDISDELVPVVQRMAGRLPEKYRLALVLADFEGMKQADLAEKLGISVSGAKSRVQRARKMLKELLLQCCHFEFDRYGKVFDYSPRNCTSCCPN